MIKIYYKQCLCDMLSMMGNRMLFVCLTLMCVMGVQAQDDDFKKSMDEFRRGAYKEYDDFRKQALMEYSDFVRQAWKPFNAEPAVPMPKEEEVAPMLAPDADQETASWFSRQMDKLFKRNKKDADNKQAKADVKTQQRKAEPKKPEPKKPEPKKPEPKKPEPKKKPETQKPQELAVKQVIPAAPVIKQPEPLAEVKEETLRANPYMKFDVFGTECKVRIGDNCRFKLPNVSSDAIADVIRDEFPKTQFDNMLYDCLQERKHHDFSDWAYYQMLLALTNKFYGEDSNEGVLVRAFLYSQSGYKMRLAQDGTNLYMLCATRHFIYNKIFFSMEDDWYFLFDGKQSDKLRICPASFPKESSLSLQISAAQRFAMNPSGERVIRSIRNPNFSVTLHSNKNYIDFCETYPSSIVDNNFMTRWAMYANTPMEADVCDQLYPQLKTNIKGMSEKQAVQELLWWMHGNLDLEGEIKNSETFLYRYDEDCWGADRAFFGEETLYYPYCDCEDRSILLSHLVRDLLGLDVVLVYYPGHLAMAVCFNENVDGDYIMVDGRKFIVCDPTYIGCRIGQTMPGMNNSEATVILLQKS
ncbi:MAG: hypothetical protein J5954_05380 [Prevotella sp.]|nr:hypothetical protein [Prevotella sp.]